MSLYSSGRIRCRASATLGSNWLLIRPLHLTNVLTCFEKIIRYCNRKTMFTNRTWIDFWYNNQMPRDRNNSCCTTLLSTYMDWFLCTYSNFDIRLDLIRQFGSKAMCFRTRRKVVCHKSAADSGVGRCPLALISQFVVYLDLSFTSLKYSLLLLKTAKHSYKYRCHLLLQKREPNFHLLGRTICLKTRYFLIIRGLTELLHKPIT
jgi:hypothetical protein